MSVTAERATKKAYFTNLAGGKLLEFQFSPDILDFNEGGEYMDRIPVGNYFNDASWISGKVSKFNLRMFVDRTQESYTAENYNNDPFDGIKRYPTRSPKYLNFDIINMLRGIGQRKPASNGEGNMVDASNYSASPHFSQPSFNDSLGVIGDVEALLYYVRPEGLELSDITIQKDGTARVFDFPQGRFTPPPKCRFHYGNLWSEGYIIDVKYNLSIPNKDLVFRRMDADLVMLRTRWGYLRDIGGLGASDPERIFEGPAGGGNGNIA